MAVLTRRARRTTLTMLVASAALHGAALAAVSRIPPAPRVVRERIEIEVVRREPHLPVPPAPPAPAAQPDPPRPAPRAVAARRIAPPDRPAPPPLATPEPPPALASAPPSAPDAPRALPRVGISLGSTVASGGFAVGVGNTAHGRAEETAADPASVRPYAGGVPSPASPASRPTAQPRPVSLPRIDYPPDARRAGVEGRVLLLLRIDPRGAVVAVRVIDAPDPSLARAAEEGARRFRFSPALRDGEPVEAEIRFTYTFLLE